MLRRFSSTFRKGKKDDSQVNGKSGNGKVANGSTSNGAAHNGRASNGAVLNGGASNGAMSNGAVSNGAVSNGAASNGAASNGSASKSRSQVVKKPAEVEHSAAGRAEVESSLKQFGQLIHAARRPLPTQAGDGAYLDEEVSSSLFQDLKSLGFKDVKTLMQVMKTKATGEYQDDKTYLMENVIQVCYDRPTNPRQKLTCLISWLLVFQIIPKPASI